MATLDYPRYAAPMRELWTTPRIVPRTSVVSRDAVEIYGAMMQTDPPTNIVSSISAASPSRPALRETQISNSYQALVSPRRLRHSKSTENLQKKAQAQPQTQLSSRSSTQALPHVPTPSRRLPSNTSSRTISPTRNDPTMKRPKSGPLRRTLRKMLSSRPSEELGFEEMPRPSTTGTISDCKHDMHDPLASTERWNEQKSNLRPLVSSTPPIDSQKTTPVPNKGILRSSAKSQSRSGSSLPQPAQISTSKRSISKAGPPPSLSLKPSLMSSTTPTPNSASSRKSSVSSTPISSKPTSLPRSYASSTSTSPKSPVRPRRQLPSPRRDSLDLTRLPRRSYEKPATVEEEPSNQPDPQMPKMTVVATTRSASGLADITKSSTTDDSSRLVGPRSAMEYSSVIARLDEIERRISQMENGQTQNKPQSSQRTMGEDTWYGHDTSSIDDGSGPRTPTSAKGFMDMDMHPVIVEDEREDGRHEGTEARLFRHSMLNKGHDVSIQRMISVLATERNARITLEEEVNTMRQTITALHQELSSKPRMEDVQSKFSGYAPDYANPQRHMGEYDIFPGMPWKELQSRFSSDSSLAGFTASSPERESQYAGAPFDGAREHDDHVYRGRLAEESSDDNEQYYTPPTEHGSDWSDTMRRLEVDRARRR